MTETSTHSRPLRPIRCRPFSTFRPPQRASASPFDDSVAKQLRDLFARPISRSHSRRNIHGVDEDVTSVGVPSLLITHADVPEDVVYEFVSQMFADEAGTYMRNVYNAWSPSGRGSP